MKVLIMAANGQIARLIEERILSESKFSHIELTLFLRQADRLSQLRNNARVTFIEGDLSDENAVNKAVAGQDLIFAGVVDHTQNNVWTKNIINAMKRNHVSRIVFTNILGIYNEVPGEFGRWNARQVMNGLNAAIESDQLLANSALQYTTLRLPWLNDRHEINYVITHRAEPYVGVSGSRRSVADLVLRIIAKPVLGINDSLGLADPSTQGENRPVY
ncbi:MAG: oxidoreductase [Lactobacillus sp.]|nr:MAG: oxidoreductase [Lactobacillus sp.]